jgi:hypothetical protein
VIRRLLVALCDACDEGLLVTFEDDHESATDTATRHYGWTVTRELLPNRDTAIVLRCPPCAADGRPAKC